MVEQARWSLVSVVERLRGQSDVIELFGRFLDETYGSSEVLFYLHARDAVRQCLSWQATGGVTWGVVGSGMHHQVLENQPGFNGRQRPLPPPKDEGKHYVNPAMAVLVVRGVVGERLQELFLNRFDMRMREQSEAAADGKPDLPVGSFLKAMTEEYQASKDLTLTAGTIDVSAAGGVVTLGVGGAASKPRAKISRAEKRLVELQKKKPARGKPEGEAEKADKDDAAQQQEEPGNGSGASGGGGGGGGTDDDDEFFMGDGPADAANSPPASPPANSPPGQGASGDDDDDLFMDGPSGGDAAGAGGRPSARGSAALGGTVKLDATFGAPQGTSGPSSEQGSSKLSARGADLQRLTLGGDAF